jgi:hypothetical protein
MQNALLSSLTLNLFPYRYAAFIPSRKVEYDAVSVPLSTTFITFVPFMFYDVARNLFTHDHCFLDALWLWQAKDPSLPLAQRLNAGYRLPNVFRCLPICTERTTVNPMT